MNVAFLSSPFGTPRHRCEHPRDRLLAQGIDATFLQDEVASFAGFTHVILNRVTLTPSLSEAMANAGQNGTRFLFDVDDLLFDPEAVSRMEFVQARSDADQARLLDVVKGIAATMERCGAGLCATPALQKTAQARGLVAHLSLNGVNDEMIKLSDQAHATRSGDADITRIGFPGGHPGHTFNLSEAAEGLNTVFERHSNVSLVVIGPVELPPSLTAWSDRIERVDYVEWKRLPFELARLDICIAPLAANAFNHCKSDIKWLEASLVRVATVASPVGQLAESIRHGVNGMLAATPQAWSESLSILIEDRRLREKLAATACEQVLRERTDQTLGPALVATLEAL